MMKGGKTIMFDTLTRIYKKTKDKTYLENAVKKGWLTEERDFKSRGVTT